MPEFLHPGVYVEEVPFGVTAIPGVSTSTVGFVGTAATGRAAVRVRSVADVERTLGGVDRRYELGYAARQFFSSGGCDAWLATVPDGVPLCEGLPALDAAESISLLCLPGESDQDVLRAALQYATRRRALLIVDPPGMEPNRSIALVRTLGEAGNPNGAIFYPPVQVADPLAAGELRQCPPSGAVAGMYTRYDRSHGVWAAHAGSDAVLPGVVDVAVRVGDEEATQLTATGVNCIRRIAGGRIGVAGARTLAGDDAASEWKYVPVRRTALFIEESLRRGTEWASFEPNGEPLWARLRAQSAVFLNALFRVGAFQGRAPHEAYFVRCGRDTMTSDDLDDGRLKLLVGFAPLRPNEFVTLQIERQLPRALTESLEQGTGEPAQRRRLSHRPLGPEGVLLQVQGAAGWTTWTAVALFDGLGPEDTAFVLDREKAELRFGDGKHGAVPSPGSQVQVTYRYGLGASGDPGD